MHIGNNARHYQNIGIDIGARVKMCKVRHGLLYMSLLGLYRVLMLIVELMLKCCIAFYVVLISTNNNVQTHYAEMG